jgi:WD40 repeat protein
LPNFLNMIFLKNQQKNRLFLDIKHTLCNKLSMNTNKQINFSQVSFNRTGDRFIACDLHGSIYMFDLTYNRFMRINRIGTTCTALAYNLKCKTEYLVAAIDGTIKCFNCETRDLVGWMKGHEKPIISLSVHPTSSELVISFSADLAQLWDLKTFQCKQKLNVNSNKNVEIVKVSN